MKGYFMIQLLFNDTMQALRRDFEDSISVYIIDLSLVFSNIDR